jgi:hypothetical protein
MVSPENYIVKNCRCCALSYWQELVGEADALIDSERPWSVEEYEAEAKRAAEQAAAKKKEKAAKRASQFKTVDAVTKEAFQDASNQVFATASVEQKAAALQYTKYDFVETNQFLYGDEYFIRPEYKDNLNKIKSRVKHLDKIIKEYKLTENIVTYRGTDAEYYIDWKVGKTYDLQGYVSTSLDKGNEIVDRDFIIEMRIKKGTRGMYLGTNSGHPGEDEFLLGRDRKYKVIEKTKKSMIVEVSN